MNNTQADKKYYEKRQLKKGAAGWILLSGLGVSYVISGDFAGWNFGIAQAGWGGFVIAVLLMATMYLCLVLSLAEMSASIPTAGGGYSFAREAMGSVGGYFSGFAILIEYALAPAAIVIFIGSAVEVLTGFNGPIIYAFFYIIFISIHLLGTGEALKTIMLISALAIFAIIATSFSLINNFDSSKLFDIAVSSDKLGVSKFLPFGWYGIWAALPFGMWLFLGVEGVPLAAEESKDPAKDIPKGIIGAITFLFFTASLVVSLVPGAAGADKIGKSVVPLVDALNSVGDKNIGTIVNILGLAGLIASFFSMIYGYSRLVFALSRAGYIPQFLSLTNKNKTPTWALIIPGIFGFLASLSEKGDLMLGMAVVGATISYAFMSISHILLRIKNPDMPRPYKTPGGIITSGIALFLSLVALTGVFAFNPRAFIYTMILYLIGILYYFLYSKNHIIIERQNKFIL